MYTDDSLASDFAKLSWQEVERTFPLATPDVVIGVADFGFSGLNPVSDDEIAEITANDVEASMIRSANPDLISAQWSVNVTLGAIMDDEMVAIETPEDYATSVVECISSYIMEMDEEARQDLSTLRTLTVFIIPLTEGDGSDVLMSSHSMEWRLDSEYGDEFRSAREYLGFSPDQAGVPEGTDSADVLMNVFHGHKGRLFHMLESEKRRSGGLYDSLDDAMTYEFLDFGSTILNDNADIRRPAGHENDAVAFGQFFSRRGEQKYGMFTINPVFLEDDQVAIEPREVTKDDFGSRWEDLQARAEAACETWNVDYVFTGFAIAANEPGYVAHIETFEINDDNEPESTQLCKEFAKGLMSKMMQEAVEISQGES